MLHVSRWNVGLALVVLAALSMLLIGQARADGEVSVTVTPGEKAITVTNSPFAFSFVALNTTADSTGAGSRIGLQNTGGLAIATATLQFDNTNEATCSSGGPWQANATAAADNVFVLNVDTDGEFSSNKVNVPPSDSPSGDILANGGGLAAITDSVILDVQLVMPTLNTSSASDCSMPMTLTAA